MLHPDKILGREPEADTTCQLSTPGINLVTEERERGKPLSADWNLVPFEGPRALNIYFNFLCAEQGFF